MACLLGPLQPGCASAPLRTAASERRKSRRKGQRSEGGGMGRPGRPGLRRRLGVAEIPAPRPPLGLGFAPDCARVLPRDPVPHTPLFSSSQWPGGLGCGHCCSRRPSDQAEVGKGRERRAEEGAATLRWSWQKRAVQSCRNLLPPPPPMSWKSRAQLKEVGARTPSPEA